jgi:hypothetical protein
MEIKIENRKPDVRRLNDMRGVLYDKDWAETAPNLDLYYMYRGIEEKDGLRYDITVIPAAMLGKEFNKTKGHEHSNKKGEVYIVLEGQAISLMQKNDGENIKDALAIKAKKGDIFQILFVLVMLFIVAIIGILILTVKFKEQRAKNKNLRTILTGCVLSPDFEKFKPHFDYILSIKTLPYWKEILKKEKFYYYPLNRRIKN